MTPRQTASGLTRWLRFVATAAALAAPSRNFAVPAATTTGSIESGPLVNLPEPDNFIGAVKINPDFRVKDAAAPPRVPGSRVADVYGPDAISLYAEAPILGFRGVSLAVIVEPRGIRVMGIRGKESFLVDHLAPQGGGPVFVRSRFELLPLVLMSSDWSENTNQGFSWTLYRIAPPASGWSPGKRANVISNVWSTSCGFHASAADFSGDKAVLDFSGLISGAANRIAVHRLTWATGSWSNVEPTASRTDERWTWNKWKQVFVPSGDGKASR